MPGTDTATVLYLRALALLMAAHGQSVEELLRDVRVDPSVLADCDARLPTDVIARVWERVAEATSDPFLGIHAAEAAPPHVFHVLDHAAANQPTLEGAARTVVQFYRLCDPAIGMRFALTREGAIVSFAFALHESYSRQWAEALAGLIVCRARKLSGVDEIAPERVRFQHPRPPLVDELSRVFRCPIDFDGASTELVFGHALLALPVRGANEFLSDLIEEHAVKQLRAMESDRCADTVGRIVIALLRKEVPRLETVAKKMGCSGRTLQQRLKREDSSFERVMDQVRRHLALQYLANPEIRLLEVPLLLKYSEPSPFYRAFLRWTGMTPAQYRAQHCPRVA
jgi:AraC-like DNA-binding protein